MAIEFTNKKPEKDQFFHLFESAGWNEEYLLNKDQLFDALHRSWFSVSVHDNDHLVGYGRVISDGILHAFIVEMIVLPTYQGKGIGSKIINELVEQCRSKGIRDIQLFCAKGQSGFYEKHGFAPRPQDAPGMEVKLS